MSLPNEVSTDLGDLLSELESMGAKVESARYDPGSFGNFEICLAAPRGAFQITRDRSQYMLQGPSRQELEAADLWRAFDRKEEFSALLVAWFRRGA